MQILGLGQTVTNPTDGDGDTEQYSLLLPAQSHYVFEQIGPGTCEIQVWGPFPGATPLAPGGAPGRLQVCGVGAWGMRVFQPGNYLVQTTQAGDPQFSLLVRQSSFPGWLVDAVLSNFHKSTC